MDFGEITPQSSGGVIRSDRRLGKIPRFIPHAQESWRGEVSLGVLPAESQTWNPRALVEGIPLEVGGPRQYMLDPKASGHL